MKGLTIKGLSIRPTFPVLEAGRAGGGGGSGFGVARGTLEAACRGGTVQDQFPLSIRGMIGTRKRRRRPEKAQGNSLDKGFHIGQESE